MQRQLKCINAYGHREYFLCVTHMTVTLRNFNSLICVMWFLARPLSLFLTHLSAPGSIFAAADPEFPPLLPNSKRCVKCFFFFSFLLYVNLDYSWSHFQERPVWTFVHKQGVAGCFVPSNWVAGCVHFSISSFVSAGCKRAKHTTTCCPGEVAHIDMPLLSDCAMTSLAISNQALNDLSPTEKVINVPGNWWGRDKKQNKWKRGWVFTV